MGETRRGHPTGHAGAEVRELFGRVAPRYDLLNQVLSLGIHRRWRRALAAVVQAEGASRILDVCTGTGDMALELARPERGRASVIALDFSEEMVSIAGAKVRRAGLRARVLPVVGDALSLPFNDGVFDAVTITFGVRNFEDTSRGLEEAVRVLRPGGVLGILEFLRPTEGGLAFAVAAAYRRWVLPRLAALAGGDRAAYHYLPCTIDHFDSPVEMRSRLEGLGLTAVRTEPLTLGMAWLIMGQRRQVRG